MEKCGCNHCCSEAVEESPMQVWRLVLSFLMLMTGIVLHAIPTVAEDVSTFRIAWYILAYLPVGLPVMKEGFQQIKQKDVFNEFTLMTLATLGAFAIGEYPEGVAVMVFYAIGEALQDRAVNSVKADVGKLLDIRPESVTVVKDDGCVVLSPRVVEIGDIIEVKPGGRIPLDGKLLNDTAFFDASALTGESVPRTIKEGEMVLAGMLSADSVIRMTVTATYDKSALARILELVEDASERKAPAELFIRKFARIYTPTVMGLALLIVLIPYIISIVSPSFIFSFHDWLYRALTFLVVSCPCALVISIPLTYFSGIGAASKRGVLFKGANFMHAITQVNTVVFDKTGTLTKGVFEVNNIQTSGVSERQLVTWVASLEKNSTHPIAKAIVKYAETQQIACADADDVSDIAGHGLHGTIGDAEVLVGNLKLLDRYHVTYPDQLHGVSETLVACAVNGTYRGCLLLSDQLKDDAVEAVGLLRKSGIKNIVMLSGDKQRIVSDFGKQLKLDDAVGDLLPDEKVKYITRLKQNADNHTIFVGDGMNDAPALALSDVGVAMGGLGSDAAIETADVVIQNDQPSKVALAVNAGLQTKKVVYQNIALALGIKVGVMILGALGIATLWEAVFADVGVALIAILNSVRVYRLI